MLFNYNAFYDIIITIGVFLVIIACMKYPSAKYFVATALVIAFVGFSVFAGLNLEYYLSAKGGIYGTIKGLIDPNSIVVDTENLSIKLDNIMLTKVDDTDRYQATCTSSDYFHFDINNTYILLIDNTPCYISELGSDYIMADYNYEFLDEEKAIKLNDTLHIRFSFNNKLSTIKIYTDGGSNALKLWNQYFAKNKMDIQLKKVATNDYVFNASYRKVTIYSYTIDDGNQGVDTFLLGVYYFQTGETFDVTLDASDDLSLLGYSYSYTDIDYIDTTNMQVNSDMTLYAIFEITGTRSITYVYANGTQSVVDYAYKSAVYKSDLPFLASVCHGTTHTYSFWSIDNCGEVAYSEVNDHALPYTNNTIGGAGYLYMVQDFTFYEATYTKTCYHSVSGSGSIV